MFKRVSSLVAAFLLLLIASVFLVPASTQTVHATGATIYNTSTSPIRVGDTIGITISVNTNGQSANSFNANFSYDPTLFTPVRGSQTGSICSIWISSPDPDSGSASLSCGKPGGFTGTGLLATIYLSATAPGTATFGLSGCQVLANDGNGTDITGGCVGSSTLINPTTVAATPPPTATPTPTVKAPVPTPTPKPKASIKPVTTPNVIGGSATPAAGGTPAPQPSAANATPTPSIAGPAAKSLPSTSPTPSVSAAAAGSEPNATQQRTISTALKDIFSSFKNLTSLKSNLTGIIALILALIPALALGFAILFLLYRLYMLDQRRRRTMDRLFEMELSELAALEGKMDLLAEKGSKGREQYREEFKLAKENILRQLKPDYGKPVDRTATSEPAKTADKIE